MNHPQKPYHVVAIGNAIVDVLSFAEDAFTAGEAMQKGTMCLIDEERAEALYNKMGPSTEVSGGSAANTLAGLASLGARTAFIGKYDIGYSSWACTANCRGFDYWLGYCKREPGL